MKHHYLIDYENVHEDGLTGLNTIEEDAVIHIFYSDRARKLDLDSFREGQILQIEALKVPVGKQSLDMQLVSYMGYLMGREKGEGNCYIIVSKDNGYLNSIPFWKQIMRDGTTVEIRPQIRPKAIEEAKTEVSKTDIPVAELKQPATIEQKKATQVENKKNLPTEPVTPGSGRQEKNERRSRNRNRGRNRREKNQETIPAVSETPVTAEASAVDVPAEAPVTVTTVAEAPASEAPVAEAPASEAPASEAPASEIPASETPASETPVVETPVAEAPVAEAPVAEAPASEAPVARVPAKKTRTSPSVKSLDRSSLNTAVMQTLSKASIDAATTGKISSIVMKFASEEHSKTKIYREIIRTLGQKQGLVVYNYIKPLL